MASSISLFKSVLGLKCPKCREGQLFSKKGLFRYRHLLSMHDTCTNCKQVFEIEPGFWIGALWTSYPIVVLIEVPFLFLALYATTVSPWVYFGCMVLAFMIFFPVMLRLGRSVWIHISVRYVPKNLN
jgi:uncharacterized protein (DUF983 family)